MVEFGLLLPLLVTLILGCVDFGRFAATYIAVTNASRTGAAFGAMNPPSSSAMEVWRQFIVQRVEEDLGSDEDLVVTAERHVEEGGKWRAEVTVQRTFRTMVNWPLIPSTTILSQTTEMRGVR